MRFALSNLLLIISLATSLSVSAGYTQTIMEPWMGATMKELTAKWGQPKSKDDILIVDKKNMVYKYHSNNSSIGGRIKCTVSFTLRKEVVVGFKYEGGNCPRHKR